jgi:hypothetical protein
MSEQFTTILCWRHQAEDEAEAVRQRFALLEAAAALGWEDVGANTTTNPTLAAMSMVMGGPPDELGELEEMDDEGRWRRHRPGGCLVSEMTLNQFWRCPTCGMGFAMGEAAKLHPPRCGAHGEMEQVTAEGWGQDFNDALRRQREREDES